MRPCRLFLVLLALALAPKIRTGQAEEPVSIKVASGRTFVGLVDARTNDEKLWLRTERGTAVLLRPIDWSRVVSARLAGEELSPDDLKSRATPQPPRPERVVPVAIPQPPAAQPEVQPVARSLALDAGHGNWDSDAEADGLLVTLYPRDARGESVVAEGQVEIECWGLERRHQKPGGELVLVERWSRPLTRDDYDYRGAVLQLPYGAINPIQQANFNPGGMVKVRLSIPGSNVLEASLDGIRLKPYTPVQNWQQLGESWPR